jgi:hypothetical protein
MSQKITQGLDWLESELNKDDIEVEKTKKRQIREIMSLDKEKMFTPPPKKTFLDKLLIVLGYGKKR